MKAAILFVGLVLVYLPQQAHAVAQLNLLDDGGNIRLGAAADVTLFRCGNPAAAFCTNNSVALNGAVTVGSGATPGVAGSITATGSISGSSLTVTGAVSASNVYSGSATLNVPGTYASLAIALAALAGKALTYAVTIQLADGTYNAQPNFGFGLIVNPEFLTIRGNYATPANVVLNQAAFGSFFTASNGVQLGGMTWNGATGTGNGLLAYGTTVRFSGPIVINNFGTAVYATYSAIVYAGGLLTVTNSQTAVTSGLQSVVDASSSSLTGPGVAVSGSIAADVGSASTVYLGGTTITQFETSIRCQASSTYSGTPSMVNPIGPNQCGVSWSSNDLSVPGVTSSSGTGFRHKLLIAKAKSTTTMTVVTSTLITLGTEVFDTANLFNPATSTFTAPIAGYYLVSGYVCFAVNAGAPYREVHFQTSSEQYAGWSMGQFNNACVLSTDTVQLSAGGTATLRASVGATQSTATDTTTGVSALATFQYVGE